MLLSGREIGSVLSGILGLLGSWCFRCACEVLVLGKRMKAWAFSRPLLSAPVAWLVFGRLIAGV